MGGLAGGAAAAADGGGGAAPDGAAPNEGSLGGVAYLGEGQLPAYEVTNGEVVLTGFLQDLASQ